MALTIRSTEADELARQLSAVTGESLADAVTNALRERLARQGKVVATTSERRRAALRELKRAFAGREVHDPRTDEEILGYNEHGMLD